MALEIIMARALIKWYQGTKEKVNMSRNQTAGGGHPSLEYALRNRPVLSSFGSGARSEAIGGGQA
jgi:hypothetical protein